MKKEYEESYNEYKQTEECAWCGQRFKSTQRLCPNCGEENEDYRNADNWGWQNEVKTKVDN